MFVNTYIRLYHLTCNGQGAQLNKFEDFVGDFRMFLPSYALETSADRMTYQFNSEGIQGSIIKIIRFQAMSQKGVYNLAFGDKVPDSDKIDDKAISNNGDREKVLATVAASVYFFSERYPRAWIYATGSSRARTRLYQMGIAKYVQEISEDFIVMGLRVNGWESFQLRVEYEGFLFRRRGQNRLSLEEERSALYEI